MQFASAALIGITLMAAFALVYWFGMKRGVLQEAAAGGPPTEAMSMLSRRILIGFLLFLALVLVYVLVALWSVEFPDSKSEKQPVLSGEGPAGAKRPWIEQLDPSLIVAGAAQSTLTVYGYNFDAGSKVYFNAVEREAVVKPNMLLVAMRP